MPIEFLSSQKIRAKKSFSQNFLVNLNAARRIVESLNLSADKSVLEIGAGKGILTQFLIEKAQKVYAVELDQTLCQFLKEKFQNKANLEIINQDILKLNLRNLVPSSQKINIIGNLPYQITSPILDWLIENRSLIHNCIIMVQKEVATRICASPGNKDFSPLSIFVQFYSNPKILFKLRPNSFYPPPKVESSVMSIEFLKEKKVPVENQKLFFQIVRSSFSTRRKTILNSLSFNLKIPKIKIESILNGLKINPQSRAESLSLEEFAKLSEKIKVINKN